MLGTLATPARGAALFDRIFSEAFSLMRERSFSYGVLAVVCALSAWSSFGKGRLLDVFVAGNPAAVFRAAPINAIMLSALLAIFFVLPAALRRIQPSFHMTLWRAALTFAMLLCIALATDAGYVAAFVPGIVLGVLLSQALIAALLGGGEPGSLRDLTAAVGRAFLGSVQLTRRHFITTLGVCALSLVMLGVPFFFGLVALLVFDALDARSLLLTAPLLFLTFVYCECARYVVIVRWYQRLSNAPVPSSPQGIVQAA